MISENATVHVVDDDSDVRESIELLGRSVQLTVNTYGSALEFLNNFKATDADTLCCLVVDVRLPGISGLELQRRLKGRKISVPMIVVSGYADVSMAVQALKAGAVDFLEKPLGGQDLLERIERALEHQQQNQLWKERHPDVSGRLKGLSPREREVMDHLLLGENAKQVGNELGISPKTVAKHRSRVLDKAGVDSVVELLRLIGTDGPSPMAFC